MHAQLCLTLCDLWTVAHQASLSMGFIPGKNTGVGCHFLLQGILTQGSYLHLLHCMSILYHWAIWEATCGHLWEVTILITITQSLIYLLSCSLYLHYYFLFSKCFCQNVTFILCGFLVVFWLMYHFQWINSIMIQSAICLSIFIIHLSNYLFTVFLVQEAGKRKWISDDSHQIL